MFEGNVEKSKNGKALLEKLSVMKPDDLDGLNELLDKWTIGDALEVLNEIDRRMAVISAIRKLAGDNTTDELHVLHPMIAESRWLFGPEYESSEYIFNRQMKTAVSTVFGNDSLHEVKRTTATFEISVGILNLIALQTAVNFCINEISFNTSSKKVILYFCSHGV